MVNEAWPSTKSSIQDFPQAENADTGEDKEKFRFITFQDPNTIKLKSIQRVIRSHGAKKSLEGRKKKLTDVTGNFRHFKTDRFQHVSARKQSYDAKTSIDIQSFTLTQPLAISNSTRLQSLIGNSMMRASFLDISRLTRLRNRITSFGAGVQFLRSYCSSKVSQDISRWLQR
jgi:hypothetical protein